MPIKLHNKITDAFFTTKTIGKGTGLGLAISGKIITNHDGTLEVIESSELKGACFKVWLPIK